MSATFFQASPARAAGNPRYGAIVVDAPTGAVLYADKADKQLHPASMTKMMTLYLTFEAVENGRIGLDDDITMSPRAAAIPPCQLGLKAGEKIKVRDAILALVTKSANDIAVAIAEHISGTQEKFAGLMNERARYLGMTNTHFTNASGWHDPKQVSTARDISRLGRALIEHYPEHYETFSTARFRYNGATYGNHNRLMSRYPGMDGIKTGFVGASGFNLAASAVRNGRRLVGVVFGGKRAVTRDSHMERLLNDSFAKLRKPDVSADQSRDPLPDPLREEKSVASFVRPGGP